MYSVNIHVVTFMNTRRLHRVGFGGGFIYDLANPGAPEVFQHTLAAVSRQGMADISTIAFSQHLYTVRYTCWLLASLVQTQELSQFSGWGIRRVPQGDSWPLAGGGDGRGDGEGRAGARGKIDL